MILGEKRDLRLSKNSRGFGLIEVMAALFVIVIALVSLLVLFGHAIATMALTQDLLIGKQKSREALESIFTARNTQQITFDQIQNVSNDLPGIFVSGYQPLKTPGADGLVGTADDDAVESYILPGPDNMLGTPDDEVLVLTQFERQIELNPVLYPDDTVNPDVRHVRVRIRFSTPLGGQRVLEMESYVSRFR